MVPGRSLIFKKYASAKQQSTALLKTVFGVSQVYDITKLCTRKTASAIQGPLDTGFAVSQVCDIAQVCFHRAVPAAHGHLNTRFGPSQVYDIAKVCLMHKTRSMKLLRLGRSRDVLSPSQVRPSEGVLRMVTFIIRARRCLDKWRMLEEARGMILREYA